MMMMYGVWRVACPRSPALTKCKMRHTPALHHLLNLDHRGRELCTPNGLWSRFDPADSDLSIPGFAIVAGNKEWSQDRRSVPRLLDSRLSSTSHEPADKTGINVAKWGWLGAKWAGHGTLVFGLRSLDGMIIVMIAEGTDTDSHSLRGSSFHGVFDRCPATVWGRRKWILRVAQGERKQSAAKRAHFLSEIRYLGQSNGVPRGPQSPLLSHQSLPLIGKRLDEIKFRAARA